MKEKALTRGGLESYELAIFKKSAEVIVGIYCINKGDMTAEFLILHFAVENSIFYIFKNKRQIIEYPMYNFTCNY